MTDSYVVRRRGAPDRSEVRFGLQARTLPNETACCNMGQAGSIVEVKAPYDYEAMVRDLGSLKRRYPLHVSIGTIGRSVMGKEIPFIRLGQGQREVHYNGSFHANEWITTPLLMKFVEDYACSYAVGAAIAGLDAARLMSEASLWVVPMVNPDGVDLVVNGFRRQHPFARQLLQWNQGSTDFSAWKANIRGVDLNDQFPACWEIERDRRAVPGPGARDYTGDRPLSEPEAAAMAAFTVSRNFRLVMAFHTQGREIYWNYRDCEPAESAALARRLEALSGYAAVKLTDSDAGYKDWFIQQFRRPGFTIEAGYGVNPLPIEQFPLIYQELLPLMAEGLVL